jgi:hypothetical protein
VPPPISKQHTCNFPSIVVLVQGHGVEGGLDGRMPRSGPTPPGRGLRMEREQLCQAAHLQLAHRLTSRACSLEHAGFTSCGPPRRPPPPPRPRSANKNLCGVVRTDSRRCSLPVVPRGDGVVLAEAPLLTCGT